MSFNSSAEPEREGFRFWSIFFTATSPVIIVPNFRTPEPVSRAQYCTVLYTVTNATVQYSTVSTVQYPATRPGTVGALTLTTDANKGG